jgi:mono/diheme cytochrome c family protein
VVLKGERTAGGMPSFGTLLKPDDAELVRAYVVKQAMMVSAPATATAQAPSSK